MLWISAGEGIPEAFANAGLDGFAVEFAPGVPEASEHVRRSRVDAVVASFPIPEWTPTEVLEELQCAGHRVPIIVVDPEAGPRDAARMAKTGAYEVLGAGFEPADLRSALEDAIQESASQASEAQCSDEPWRHALVGFSQAFQDVIRMVRLVGNRRSTVLITGETGTGKEMVARALHLAGPRGRLPMVSVCCSALPENLLEAELFGHVRGAFTGAINQRIGRFEQASGSTIFLDEIGDMPLDLQSKLLRVLQEREFQRLGSSETIRADVRVIAATNADLLEKVREGRFREDLYYRLNVVPIHMPPLRARGGDVAALTRHFTQKVCTLENNPLKQISREALDRLAAYSWPGNVRQLENSVERAVILSGTRPTLYPSDFPLAGGRVRQRIEHEATPLVQVPDGGLDFDQTVGQIARSILEQALRKTNGNKKLAADMLGLKRTTLAAKLRSLEGGGNDPDDLSGDFVHSA